MTNETAMRLPSILKKTFQHEGVRRILCGLSEHYIRWVYHSSRWEVVGNEAAAALWDNNQPFILVFWHARLLMMPYCWPQGKKMHMLISQHRDGQMIANIVKRFGIEAVPGSTHKGGSVAFRALLKILKTGEYVGITPDGPQGPAMIVSEGLVQVARLSGVPVIPCTFSARDRYLLNTWDRFMVARPFTKGIFIWGQPISLSAKANIEEQEAFRSRIEDSLRTMTVEADRRMGHSTAELEKRTETAIVSHS